MDENWGLQRQLRFHTYKILRCLSECAVPAPAQPVCSVPTTHQSSPSGIAKRFVLLPRQEALRALVSF